jgi:hypothetical protein
MGKDMCTQARYRRKSVQRLKTVGLRGLAQQNARAIRWFSNFFTASLGCNLSMTRLLPGEG